MKHKNCWNKKFKIIEKEIYARDENGKIIRDEKKKPVVARIKRIERQVQGGIKADKNEIRFRKAINKIKVDKPKLVKGTYEKEN